LLPDDIAELFVKILIRTTGNIVYIPILLAESDGKIFLEVHQDVNHKSISSIAEIESMVYERNMFDRIDWLKANHVFELQEGIDNDVTYL
jgi:hypothetical protein